MQSTNHNKMYDSFVPKDLIVQLILKLYIKSMQIGYEQPENTINYIQSFKFWNIIL